MSIIEAIVLGLVQGLTEFIPISSTAHLEIVPVLLGWGDPGRAVWVRGLLLDGRGTPVRSLTLCVPASQPRAVPAPRVPPTDLVL